MSKRASPLKERPLRLPGQSLDEEIRRLETDEIGPYAAVATVSVILAAYLWIIYLTRSPIRPWPISTACLIFIVFALIRIRRARNTIRNLQLGRDGERHVAEMLDTLRSEGAAVFNDILGPDFNIDHVVVSTRGLYVIETKTRSKRTRSRAQFDGKRLLLDGAEPAKDWIGQATALARWLSSELLKTTGKPFRARPVIVLPGWYVDAAEDAYRADLWVLNPKALPGFIQHRPEQISQNDVHLVAYHLARIVRTSPNMAT